MVHWICLISWRVFDVFNIILKDYASVWHDIWPPIKCRSLWPIFHDPVILSYIWNSIWWMKSYFWKMSPCNTTFDLKINLGHSDLHFFRVEWFLFFYFFLWKTFKFYWQSTIQASYTILGQLLLHLVYNFFRSCSPILLKILTLTFILSPCHCRCNTTLSRTIFVPENIYFESMPLQHLHKQNFFFSLKNKPECF